MLKHVFRKRALSSAIDDATMHMRASKPVNPSLAPLKKEGSRKLPFGLDGQTKSCPKALFVVGRISFDTKKKKRVGPICNHRWPVSSNKKSRPKLLLLVLLAEFRPTPKKKELAGFVIIIVSRFPPTKKISTEFVVVVVGRISSDTKKKRVGRICRHRWPVSSNKKISTEFVVIGVGRISSDTKKKGWPDLLFSLAGFFQQKRSAEFVVFIGFSFATIKSRQNRLLVLFGWFITRKSPDRIF